MPWVRVPNNSFKPNLLRYTNNVAGKACHVVGYATQVGLTQALGLFGGNDSMAMFLKLRCSDLQPERFTAMEYASPGYVSWAHDSTLPDVRWQSEPLPLDALLTLLARRGWHQTDIGDELDEARRYTRPEA